MFDQIFLAIQVKRSVIISNKHDIYDVLGSEEIGKYQEYIKTS